MLCNSTISLRCHRYSGSHWDAYCWCPVVALTFPFVWHHVAIQRDYTQFQYYTLCTQFKCTHQVLIEHYSITSSLERHHRTTPSIDDTVDRRLFKRVFQESLSKRLSLNDIPKDSPIYLLSYLPPLQVISDDSSLSSGGSFSLFYVSNIAFLLWYFLVFFENLRKSSAIFVIFQYFWYLSKNFKTSPANLLVVFIIRQKVANYKVANYKVTIWRSSLIAAAGANDNWSIKM